jgi:hypothetical protein
MSNSARRPGYGIDIQRQDLAVLEGAEQSLAPILAAVAEGSECYRSSPFLASKIRGAAKNLLKWVEKGRRAWRFPPPDGQPLPEIGLTDSGNGAAKSNTTAAVRALKMLGERLAALSTTPEVPRTDSGNGEATAKPPETSR